MEESELFKQLRMRISTLRGDAPLVISALDILGIRGRTQAKAIGQTEASLSQLRNGVRPMLPHHQVALLALLGTAHAAALMEAAAKPTGSAGLRAARAGLILRALEEASHDK